MKLQPQVRKKSSTNPDTSIHKSLHERPLNTQSVKNSLAPLTQQKRVNQQYQQDRFEAAKLQIQAKYGTITAEGQEQLAFLQAKKAAFWQQHLQNTRFYNQDSSQIPVHGIDVSSKQAIQTKLTIGAPGDKYEQEADKVAAQVVKQINAPVSGQSNQNLQREEMPLEDKLMMAPHISNIQREAMPEEEELQTKPMLQLQAGDSSTIATAELESSIQQARGGGQPLADNIRKPMEQAFGADFSGVKVHTDSHADQLNKSIQAKATTGQDMFFRQGAYEPGSRGGQELIAHELTHVVQQSRGAISELVEAQYIQLKGGDQKSKGEDYANNVPALIKKINTTYFNNQFIDKDIEEYINTIETERPKCAFHGNLSDEDTNQKTYSSYCVRLNEAMQNLQNLMSAGRLNIKAEGFIVEASCNRIISELPTQAIDQRVKEAHLKRNDISNKKEISEAIKKIDDSLMKLAIAMSKRIKLLLDQKMKSMEPEIHS